MSDATVLPFTRESLEIIERKEQSAASVIVERARALQVVDAESYVAASEFRKDIKRKDAAVEEEFKKQKRAIEAGLKTVRDFEKRVREPYGVSLGLVDAKLLDYTEKEKERARQEEARLREIARKADEDRRLREAEAAVDAGVSQEEALGILDQRAPIPAPTVPAAVPKVAGITYREVWSAKVVSLPALLQFAVMHPELAASLVMPNDVGLNALARSQKHALAVDGVVAICEKIVAGART